MNIQIHNELYEKVFNDNLKPKHHNATHYSANIRKSGPLKNYWCMRFEGNHKKMKTYVRSTYSRKDICWSLANKCSFDFVFKVMTNAFAKNNFKIIKSKEIDLKITEYYHILANYYKPIFECHSIQKIEYHGIIYKHGFFLFNADKEELYQIKDIIQFSSDTKNVHFILRSFSITRFDKLFRIFVVGAEEKKYSTVPILVNNMKPFLLHTLCNGTKFFKHSQC